MKSNMFKKIDFRKTNTFNLLKINNNKNYFFHTTNKSNFSFIPFQNNGPKIKKIWNQPKIIERQKNFLINKKNIFALKKFNLYTTENNTSTPINAQDNYFEIKISGDDKKNRSVGKWLLVVAGMTFLMVVIGGITRLTESGLSMVDWKLIIDMIPPLTDEEWEKSFEKYKLYPEFQQNKDMTVSDYKRIFFWEWFHRTWGRVIGLAFGVPLVYFAAKGKIRGKNIGKLALLFFLGGFQGFLGWWMVKSGLDKRIIEERKVARVDQIRLTVHLGSAFVLYSALLWYSLDFLRPSTVMSRSSQLPLASMKNWTTAGFFLVFATAMSGALVAGLDAGLCYNEFPLMGGQIVPFDYLFLNPWYVNLYENSSAVQFNHRVLGVSTFSYICFLFWKSRKLVLPRSTRLLMNTVMAVVSLQVALGISTLLTFVDIRLAATHQSGSLTLLSFILWLLHDLRRIKIRI
eukprot:TRINITY_DN4245_c0_g1_i1.p1 TRINITY_DN4245_c0_g1~~TRINITY_DN4245_c0_g1_i1.p1  ORF type:complete len:459 (-),score=96.61 TRINITY_DN4245_c0_g1_i1:32-1408(-)